jgi:heavy metal sensor kinase
MQFVVWRPNRSVLSRSDGVPESKLTQPLIPPGPGPTPQLRRGDGGLEVLMRGPHETTILVLRPLEHDLANLYRFGYQISGVAAATLVVGLMGGWWISGRIVQPIQMISETAAQMSATNLDRRIQVNNLDQELVPLATVLNTTFGRLEQSFSRLTQFTADASHELRTPLAVIQSQAELALSQSRTSEYYQQALETCLRSADRMRSLVDGLLLLARTDSDRLELHRGPLDLRLIAEDAVMQLQEKAITAGVELECRTPEVPVMISADPVFLAQVPTNLIDNAIQHTPAGGKIIVDVRLDGTHAVLSVQDTGYGITPEHLPHLFERFYRVDIGRSRRHGGSGLGLAICRSLVEAHGGHIECKSVPGKGSTFTIRLALLNSVSTNIQGTHDA